MKKLLMAVLSSVCFSMVAQASAMTWSCGSVTATTSTSITVAPGDTIAFAFAVSLTNVESTDDLGNIGTSVLGGPYYLYYVFGGQKLDNIVVMNYRANDDGSLRSVSMYFNDNYVVNSVSTVNPLPVELYTGDAFQITSAAVYDSALTAEQVAVLRAANDARALAPSVPEPTVLALLALGVAGLALKRRV